MDTNKFVKIINISAISSLEPILDHCPELEEVMNKGKTSTADWDMLLTAAGVGFGLIQDKNLSIDIAMQTAASIHPQLPSAIENYFDFISRGGIKDRETLGAQTGIWVVWNLLKEEPTYEKHARLISLIGHYIDRILK
jgi:hypothetical protein